MDMVGRMNGELVLHGIGSSSVWGALIERGNVTLGVPISPQPESYLPTDSTSFYTKGVPVLSAFTGSHAEYHTPRDTADRLDYEGSERVARLLGELALALARESEPPDYVAMQRPGPGPARATIRVYLGTIPDYARSDVRGVALSGVSPGGPAQRAGLRSGDVIVRVAGQTIENIYDYTFSLDALKAGQPAEITVLRDGHSVTLSIVPEPRD